MSDPTEEYREVCREIARLAKDAETFAMSSHAAISIDHIGALVRKAHSLSGHRLGLGVTFMDCPEANVFRFKEPVQIEEQGLTVAFVRGRNSPFMPEAEA